MTMSDLQVFIADLTPEQFAKVCGICAGFNFVINVVIQSFFAWLHYRMFRSIEDEER